MGTSPIRRVLFLLQYSDVLRISEIGVIMVKQVYIYVESIFLLAIFLYILSPIKEIIKRFIQLHDSANFYSFHEVHVWQTKKAVRIARKEYVEALKRTKNQ